MSNKAIGKKVFSGIMWESSTKLIIQIASWTSTIIVARLLSPDDYGLVAIAGIFTGFLIIISELGLAQGLINISKIEEIHMQTVFWLSLLFSFLLYLTLFIAAPYIADAYNEEEITSIIRVSASMLVFASLKVLPMAILMRDLRFKYTAMTQLVSQGVNIITVITLAYQGYGAWALIYSVIASQIVQMFAFLPLLGKIPRFHISLKKTMPIIKFGFSIMGSRILEYITNQSTTFILSTSVSKTQVGYYNMSDTIANLPVNKIGTIFNKVTFPAVSRIKDDKQAVANLVLKLIKYLMIIVVPVFFTLLAITEELVTFLLTEKWKPIVPFLQILLVMNIFRIAGMLIPSVLNGLGLANIVFNFNLLSAILISLAVYIGLNWGMIIALFILAVTFAILQLFLMVLLFKKINLGLSKLFTTFMPSVIGGIGMLAIVFYMKPYFYDLSMEMRTIIVTSVALAFYGIYIFLLYGKDVLKDIASLRANK